MGHNGDFHNIQINTRQDRTKRIETAANKFRVRCLQLSLAPANASLGPWRDRPQPSMPGPSRQAYLDVKGEQSLEQLGLAIKNDARQTARSDSFPCGARVIQ